MKLAVTSSSEQSGLCSATTEILSSLRTLFSRDKTVSNNEIVGLKLKETHFTEKTAILPL